VSILKLLEELNSLVDPAEKENKLEAIASIMFNEGANLLALGIEIDENESEDGAVRFTYPEMYLDVVMIGGEKPDVYTVKMIRKTVCDAIVYALGLEMIAANDFNAELLEATANAVFNLAYDRFEGTARLGEKWTMNKYYAIMEEQVSDLREYIKAVKEKVKFS